MPKSLAVLNIEDSESDSDLVARLLKKAGYKITFERVETAAQMRAALKKRTWDIIISDHSLPQFDSFTALALLREEELDIPFIVVSGTIGEEAVVEMMKAGAHDFLIKDNLMRLIPAVERELEFAKVRRERKQAQEALLESESRFRQVWETTSDAMALSDSEGIVLTVNPACLSLYGYSPEQVIGHSFTIIFPQENRGWIVEQYKNLFASEVIPSAFESVINRADGTQRVVESKIAFITKAGARVAMLSTIHDITERKQADDALHASEKRFRALTENSADAITLLDAQGSVIYDSPSAPGMLGYGPEEWIGQSIFELIHADDLHEAQELLQKLIGTTGAHMHGIFRLRHKNNSWRWMEAVITNLLGEPGVQAIVINYRDITERKWAETVALESEERYRSLFEDSPIALWEEDFSVVKQHLDTLRENGVTNFNEYFNLHPEAVVECASLVKILDINKATIKLFGAAKKDDLLTDIAELLEDEPIQQFQNELVNVAEGKTIFGWEGIIKTLDGELKNIELSWRAVPDHENSLSRVIVSMIDITERKQIETALVDSEQAHRTLFENVPVGLYRTSADGRMLDANPALIKMFGYQDRESLLAVKVENLYADPASKEFYDEMVKSGIITSLEAEFRKKDGTTFWIEDHTQVIRDENGNPLFYEGSLIDITERKRSEEALQESEERFRSLFNRMMDGVYRSKHEGKFVDVNPAMVNMFGYSSREEMLAVDIKNELYFKPEERGSHILDTGQEEMDVYRMRRKDGSEIWVEDHGSYVHDEQGRIIYHEGILRDVTERKRIDQALAESEARFRQAIVAADAIPYSLDYSADRYTFIGEEIIKLTGHSLEEMTPALLDTLIVESIMHGRFEGMSLQEAVRLIREGESGILWRCDHRIRTRLGEERWISDSSIQVLDENGTPKGSIGIIQDITERKHVEAAAREGEARYRSLFEDSPVPLWEEDFSAVKLHLDILRDEGIKDFRAYFASRPQMVLECIPLVKIVDVNKAALKLFGAKAKTDLLQNLSGFLNNDSAELFQNELISIAQGKSHFEGEGVTQTLDGRQIIIRLSLSVMAGYENTFSKVIISMMDITDSIQAEKIIRESEKSLRESQAIAGLGSYVLDIPSGMWTSSDILNQILGINELYTSSAENWLALVHPDLRQEMSDYLTNEVLGNHILFNKEYKIIRNNDGAERWVYGLGELEFDEHNQPVKMRGTIQDITERKQVEEALRASEQRYRALFEDMPIAIWEEDFSEAKKYLDSLKGQGITDFHTYFKYNPEAFLECATLIKILDVNQATLKMYHADSKDDLYKSMDNGLSESEVEHIGDALIAISEGKTSHGWEGVEQTVTGEPIEVSLRWTVAPGHEADFSKVIVTTVDITDRKKAEAESQYQLSELEALYENGLAISRLLEPKRIAQRMVEVIDQKLNWHHAAIRLYDASTDRLELLALNSPGFDETQIGEQIERINRAINTPDKGLSGWVIRHGEVVRIGKLKDDPRYLETYAGIHSGLYVPIKSGDEIIGSIAVESEQENAFTKRDATTLTTLANQAAISFVNARLYLWLQKELDERHQAEEQVRKLNIELEQRVSERTAQIEATKRRLELATHAGQIGVWEYNPRENKVIWDERMHMIHQIPSGEFDGTSQTWAQLIHPDDIEQSQINRQLAVTKNLLMNNEHRIIWPDGSVRHIMTSATTAYSPEGTPERIIGINMDITERKQIEQSLRESEAYARLLFDAVQEPISVTEAGGLIVDVNEVFAKQYNLVRDEIRGKHISELGIYPETELNKREKYLSAVLQGQPVKPIELDFYMPGDRIHTLELHSYLLKVNSRQLTLNTSHDITAYKKAEEIQRLAKSEIEHALRIKNEFLANMSHELRTPLNSILGISESLEEQIAGTLNEKQLKYIGIVRESGRHLLDLINDILDLSKIEAGRMELDIHRISVETLCQSSLRMIKELSQKKNLNVSFKIQGDIKIVRADQRRLKQSLVNLLSNAVKFTPQGKEIGLEVKGKAETNEVEFTVWDQGVGIAENDIKRIFKPFVQLDAGLAREFQGTGLGLALVAQMIQLHGGHVRVESEVGKGSRFIITLPWSPKEQTPKAKVTAELSLPSPRSHEKRIGRILLVEDTDVVVQLISEYLRYKGHEVILAHNGVEAVKLAAQEHPDLILMDVMMPIMDGLEATRRIRTDETLQNIPIIALTALAMSGDSERCLEAGMNDYLSKPLQMQNLGDMIEKYLGSTKEESNEQ